ncbi:MAG: GFA family protein, partial [Candidatus Binatia bacterium]
MVRSSCLCGGVTWEIEGELRWMSHCHCSRCRKSHGSAFATFVAGAPEGLRLHGAENIVRWQSSANLERPFCRRCGAKVPGSASDGMVFLAAGNLLDDPGLKALMHIFTASQAPWYEIEDELPRSDAYPTGFDAPTVED